MDMRGIGTLIIKITGLVMLVLAVVQIPAYFPLMSRGYDFSLASTLGTAALGLGPLALAGLLLWFFPATVTNRIVAEAAPASPTVDFRPLELVAITVLGIYLVASAIVGGLRDMVIVIVMSRRDSAALIPASIVGHIAATIAELAIGITLCIGARGISTLVERLRR